MLNPECGEIKVLVGGVERLWCMTTREARWLEAEIQAKTGQKVDLLKYLFTVGEWGVEDYQLALLAGLGHYGPVDKEDLHMSMQEEVRWRIAFNAWVSTIVPEDLKKKAEEQARSLTATSPSNGRIESN